MPASRKQAPQNPHVAARGVISHIRDLTPDPKNRRKRTARNVGMIVDALQKVGASRSADQVPHSSRAKRRNDMRG